MELVPFGHKGKDERQYKIITLQPLKQKKFQHGCTHNVRKFKI